MQADYTDVTVVLDRSGSMRDIQQDMEGGFASFVAKQQALPGRCLVTMVQFDSEATEVRYAARENNDTAITPRLTVTFTP